MGARPRLLATCALAGLLAAGPAVGKPLYNKPVYDPKTKSYFELVPTPYGLVQDYDHGITWTEAEQWVQKQRYKGAHGRLAVIKSLATHEFLIDTFRPQHPTWIGLRYFCRERALVWTDGSHATKSSFAIWGTPWHVGFACRDGGPYAPAYYTARDGVFYWWAQGIHKKYSYMFVEYPTGAP